MVLLNMQGVTKRYPLPKKKLGFGREYVTVVNDISLQLEAGTCLGIVGESGAGKSTLGRLALRLIDADAGTIELDGRNLMSMRPKTLRAERRNMQMIFQDPYSSVDPRMTIAQSVYEPLRAHHMDTDESPERAVARLLDAVGLAQNYAKRYPAELSGGQLQRVSIARALAVRPKLIVCDEPVTALDVSVRAQVINLLLDLKDEFGLAYLFISHDLSVVQTIADRVMVMRNGTVVEQGATSEIFENPTESYTRDLLDAVPRPRPRARQRRA
ncbi:ATP-binding cassette domain-containing protein [Microbacterium sp. NC79]|uniref:ATP-binding cassette domain-containing protein n=1 Tax=Microbacterium sp. NC79 TaxID=2851009 RepID=UPI001C2BD25F|nr:ATP-binding cassette domain-containing protein [Microbacterium sp. NC79]MBV0895775.1 ATP-binding cassette domain-containing protein [Microbacterium sp. NC79]